MIKVSKLYKSFNQTPALLGLSFQVKTGEIVGFLGPNGAGKTTTMRLLTGFMSPDSGKITINGHDLSSHRQAAQSLIGYLPENNPLYPDMLVSEMIDLVAQLKQVPASQRQTATDFVVDAVDIGSVFYRPIRELSKGYRQRVGMALALLNQPQILIMDEPTEGLDPNQRTEIRSLIKNLSKDRTIIVSTHVMSEASAIANRLLIISSGKIVADGSPKKITQTSDSSSISAQIEGPKISSELKKISDITNLKIQKLSGRRYQVNLTTSPQVKIQPQISRLAAQHGWTIWSLTEQTQDLEDVFHQLTQTT